MGTLLRRYQAASRQIPRLLREAEDRALLRQSDGRVRQRRTRPLPVMPVAVSKRIRYHIPMSTVLIAAEIRRFLASDVPEVLCVSGMWGVGKTFTW
jgi:hypothetical protein